MSEIKRPAQGGNASGGNGRRPAGATQGEGNFEPSIAPGVVEPGPKPTPRPRREPSTVRVVNK